MGRRAPTRDSVWSVRLHVTGGTGFLGSALLRHAAGASAPRIDVRDGAALQAALRRSRPDVVIHTAYRQDGPEVWDTNVSGSASVAVAAHTVGARLIHLSTDVVFDGTATRPYREDDPVNAITAYGRSKAEAEERVLAGHPEALVVRTSLILGGPDGPPSSHESLAADPVATFYTDEIRSPVLVDDLALALLELANSGRTGVLHVAGADHVSRAELAALTAGRPVRTAPAPPGRPKRCALDSGVARSILTSPLRGVHAVAWSRRTDVQEDGVSPAG